jgi:hypothetical protein
MNRAAPLAEALAAEHAAIFAYGAIGVRLDEDETEAAREAEAVHRQRRDALVVLLDQRGVMPPVAAAAYAMPFPVTDAARARELAVLVEERVGVVWRTALAAVTLDDRDLVLAALIDTAVRATRWRMMAGMEPPTVPFPGAPPEQSPSESPTASPHGSPTN